MAADFLIRLMDHNSPKTRGTDFLLTLALLLINRSAKMQNLAVVEFVGRSDGAEAGARCLQVFLNDSVQ